MTVVEKSRTGRFFRTVDWRRIWAEELAKGQSLATRRQLKDEVVKEYLAYLGLERTLVSRRFSENAVFGTLDRRHPDMATAVDFYNNRNTLASTSLRAHLLTELSYEQIAVRFEIEPRAVELYGKLFFDVRDRLDNLEYIAGYVIGPVFQSGIDMLNVLSLSHYFAYFGGSTMLHYVMYGLARSTQNRSDDELLGYLEAVVDSNVKLQTAIITTFTQPGRFDLRTLLEGYTMLKAARRDEDNSLRENNWVAAVVQLAKGDFGIPRGREERNRYRDDTKLTLDGVVLEPRTEQKELMTEDPDKQKEILDQCRNFTIDRDNEA